MKAGFQHVSRHLGWLVPGVAFFSLIWAFAPGLSAEPSLLDDIGMIDALSRIDSVSIRGLFVPKSIGGSYYRPLLVVTQLFDRFVWQLHPCLMHLENLLLHLANIVLLWLAGRQGLSLTAPGLSPLRSAVLAGVAALFFGLHPLTVESVVWISGRTDLLAGVFALLALNAVLAWRLGGPCRLLFGAWLMLLAALLSKETTLGLTVGLLWVALSPLFVPPAQQPRFVVGFLALLLALTSQILLFTIIVSLLILGSYAVYQAWILARFARQKRTLLIVVGAGSVSLLGFILLRKLVFASNMGHLAKTVQYMTASPGETLQRLFSTAGFYAVKVFWPWPLNVAITEVDPLYALAGTLVVFVVIHFCLRPSLSSAIALAGATLLLPAFLLIFGTIAWTPLAERYLYLPLAFWSLALVLGFVPYLSNISSGLTIFLTSAAVGILTLWGVTTHHRAEQWRYSTVLFLDATEKSPRFRKVGEFYMWSLLREQRYAEARAEYRRISQLPMVQYDPFAELLLAEVAIGEGQMEEAQMIYEEILGKKINTRESQSLVRGKYIDLLRNEKSTALRWGAKATTQRLLALQEELFYIDGDPFQAYLLGKEYLRAGRREDAMAAFAAAEHLASPGVFFQTAAARMQKKLQSNTQMPRG